MNARRNSSDASLPQQRINRRTEVRYELVRLLRLEEFDAALHGALVARNNEDIRESDLQFVVEIVKAAEERGRAQINRTRFPRELFEPTGENSKAIPAK